MTPEAMTVSYDGQDDEDDGSLGCLIGAFILALGVVALTAGLFATDTVVLFVGAALLLLGFALVIGVVPS